MLKWKCELSGTSLMTAVTFNDPPQQDIFNVFPIGSSSPKYFFAIDCVITTDVTSLNAVLGSPLINVYVKMSKKLLSTLQYRFSLIFFLSPYSINQVPPQSGHTLVTASTSGISFCMAGANAGGEVASGIRLPSSLIKSFTTR